MHILHIIPGLGKGGAETMLVNIVEFDKNNEHEIISLKMSSYYETILSENGIVYHLYDFRKKPFNSLWNIHKLCKNAEVISSWLYIGNFISIILKFLHPKKKFIWNIRHSNVSKYHNSLNTRFLLKIERIFSYQPDCIIYNGITAKYEHERIGFKNLHSYTIENGCDLNYYQYHETELRSTYKILENEKIIISLSRFHPIKDIPLFLEVLSESKKENIRIRGFLCGSNNTIENETLMKLIRKNGLKVNQDIFLLGECNNIPELLSMADIFLLHSKSEAFPNSLIQAMACKCFIISTCVGDVPYIIQNNDYVVEIGNVNAIINKIKSYLSLQKDEVSKIINENYKNVSEKYNIKNIVKKYSELYTK